MNRRETAVLVFLTVTLLVGAGVNYLRRVRLLRHRPPLEVVEPALESLPQERTDLFEHEQPRVPLDLNRASVQELEALPGIGPKLALRIVEYREKHGRFRNPNELRHVSGIGPKRLAALKELVTVGEP